MLYIVATPIGNSEEITRRALDVLGSVAKIYCEDTRRTRILMDMYAIKTKLYRYDKFSERATVGEIVASLMDGEDIALVSDAGMPLISDPGSILLQEIISQGIPYTVVSGACACINAVVLSGIDTSRFFMAGFLPNKNKDRDELLDELKGLRSTLVFYTPPHGVDDDLAYLYGKLGARRCAIVREISKLYEQVIRFELGSVPQFVHKGEMVLVVEGTSRSNTEIDIDILASVKELIAIGYDKKEAIKEIATKYNKKKSDVYALVVGDKTI